MIVFPINIYIRRVIDACHIKNDGYNPPEGFKLDRLLISIDRFIAVPRGTAILFFSRLGSKAWLALGYYSDIYSLLNEVLINILSKWRTN